jgi:hypothetical protein
MLLSIPVYWREKSPLLGVERRGTPSVAWAGCIIEGGKLRVGLGGEPGAICF